jgi:hypothetical protein
VIAPSLPGYGFSGPPIRDDGSTGPIGPRAIAGLWHRLVHDKLNYRRPYGAQGGDWGAVVSSWLAFDHPVKQETDDWKSGVAGLHLNMVGVRPGIDLKTTALSPPRRSGWARWARPWTTGSPTSASGDAAADPRRRALRLAGRAGGVDRGKVPRLERLHGDPANSFSMDTLLDNVMVYWLTGTAGTATWLYRGVTEQKPRALPPGSRVEVPTAFAGFPADLAAPPPREWIEARLRPAPPHRHAQGRPLRRARGAATPGRRHPRILPAATLRRRQRLMARAVLLANDGQDRLVIRTICSHLIFFHEAGYEFRTERKQGWRWLATAKAEQPRDLECRFNQESIPVPSAPRRRRARAFSS